MELLTILPAIYCLLRELHYRKKYLGCAAHLACLADKMIDINKRVINSHVLLDLLKFLMKINMDLCFREKSCYSCREGQSKNGSGVPGAG